MRKRKRPRSRRKFGVFQGERIGRLITQEQIENQSGKHWSVLCDCGAKLLVKEEGLLSGRIRRCNSRSHPKATHDESLVRTKYRAYMARAIRKGIPFNLPYGSFKEMLTWNCAYCGWKQTPQAGRADSYNGLDQVFSAKGYTGDNTIPCCWKCNKAKSTMTQKEFIEWVKAIAENMHTSIWGSDHPVSLLLSKLEQDGR